LVLARSGDMGLSKSVVFSLVSFSPNWTPIFPGESVTLSCNVAPTAQGNLGYSWYRYGHRIPGDQQSLTGVMPSGYYQCQAGASERSDPVRLDIKYTWLILQAPPAVHEGDSLSLRCHSRPGYDTRDTIFYKDNEPIGSPVSDSELQIGRVGVTASGTYRCDKEIYFYYPYRNGYRIYVATQHISVSGKTQETNVTLSAV
uniref:Ig-like domain-containing protein n=1 Tax=Xenopus tropicalis TaxID=8364 RepID=A0A6I8RVK7_XENTR